MCVCVCGRPQLCVTVYEHIRPRTYILNIRKLIIFLGNLFIKLGNVLIIYIRLIFKI